jgi:replicative DNA helicase
MSQLAHVIQKNQLQQEEFVLYDHSTERAFLCCLMVKPDLIIEAERTLQPEAVYQPLNRYVYQVMLYIYRNAAQHGWPQQFDPMSMMSVAQYMGQNFVRNFLEKTDGMQQVRDIEALKHHIRIEQFQHYVQILIDRSTRVEIYRRARQMQEAALNFAQYPLAEQIASEAGSELGKLAFRGGNETDSRITKMSDAEAGYIGKVTVNHDNPDKGLFSVTCNLFPFLMNKMNGGYRRRGLTMVCARPKVGKSSWLLANAVQMAVVQQIPVLYIDTEMSREEMFGRGIAHVSGIQEFDIMRGIFLDEGNGEMATHLEAGLGLMRRSPLYYVNIAGKPIHFVQSVMRQFRNQHVGTTEVTSRDGQTLTFSNRAAVIYDWLKLPDPGSLKQAAEHQMLGFAASAIKDAANELDLPVIAGAQNNRGAIGMDTDEWEEMGEGVVAGSDRIAQFCTMLCVLRNVVPAEEQLIRANLAKYLRKDGERKFEAETGLWTYEGKELEGHAALPYNQMLHIFLQRGGPDYRRGIPLYLDRGRARYEELALKRCSDNTYARAKNGWFSGEENRILQFTRERQKALHTEKTSKAAKLPGGGAPDTASVAG